LTSGTTLSLRPAMMSTGAWIIGRRSRSTSSSVRYDCT
jgi:hypothetical protein